MNELVEIVHQKSGLSEEKCIEIVKSVVEFVKGKLPAALASHVDGLVGDLGGTSADAIPSEAASVETRAAGMLSSVVGNLFGSKKEV